MRSFEYIFAPIGACLVAILLIGAFGMARIDFFPAPALLVLIFTIAYYAFRKRLDHATPFEQGSVTKAARIGGGALAAAAAFSLLIVRSFAVPAGFGYSSEWCSGSIVAASPEELLDMFMASDKFLEEHGFRAQGDFQPGFGSRSGMISPHMATFYYRGSYQGSPPFTVRLDILRDDKMLVAYADPAAASQSAYDAVEKPSRDFVAYMTKRIQDELTAYRQKPTHP